MTAKELHRVCTNVSTIDYIVTVPICIVGMASFTALQCKARFKTMLLQSHVILPTPVASTQLTSESGTLFFVVV